MNAMKLPSTYRFADEKIKGAFYKLERGDHIVVSLILEWFDHNEYERRFKY